MRMFVYVVQKVDHSLPLEEITSAAKCVSEDLVYRLTLRLRILATSMLLAVEAMSLLSLTIRRNPAVD